ncbi:OmpA family protein [Flavobacterium lacisediminis]|uniref:OmpA family protein n=1 Tax=Flavobacterium lacisediminis TaxID=2989705 RepID=A0ABT3EI33_9FLAO|nr:OmpA family protein [Flavobacterium lacisediminis]MCW1148241.1 OmpA family protein [Flavobacterium lacisediminis]
MLRFLLYCLLTTSFSFSQAKFTVYFDTDSYQLNSSELNRLDGFLKNKELKFNKVIGYCDYRASNGYNDTLASNRAKFVIGIIEKVTNQKQIEIDSKGENFEQNSDLKLNRKVEIFYEELQIEKTLPKDDKKDLSQQVSTAKVGDKLVLKNLHFYNRSGIFVPESRPILQELLQIMKNNPNLKIEIQGHICCQIGTDIEETAKVRALAVYNFLIENGINKNRLSYKSFGSSRPIHIIPENNEDERNENRRVEIQIIAN